MIASYDRQNMLVLIICYTTRAKPGRVAIILIRKEDILQQSTKYVKELLINNLKERKIEHLFWRTNIYSEICVFIYFL